MAAIEQLRRRSAAAEIRIPDCPSRRARNPCRDPSYETGYPDRLDRRIGPDGRSPRCRRCRTRLRPAASYQGSASCRFPAAGPPVLFPDAHPQTVNSTIPAANRGARSQHIGTKEQDRQRESAYMCHISMALGSGASRFPQRWPSRLENSRPKGRLRLSQSQYRSSHAAHQRSGSLRQ